MKNKSVMKISSSLPLLLTTPRPLVEAIQKIYEPLGLHVTSAPFPEAESEEYGAWHFSLNNMHIAYREFKITPNKKMKGEFVTLWKRENGIITPLNYNDTAFVVISAFSDQASDRGQFVFNNNLLIKKGIMSDNNKKGKLAFRIYPPWVVPTTKAAEKSQKWQCEHFLPFTATGAADAAQVENLFKKHLSL